MEDDLTEALGRAWRNDRPWRLLTRLSELDGRLAGHAGAGAAAAVVADAFEAAGVRDVREEPFDLPVWTPGDVELGVDVPGRDGSRTFETAAMPYSPPCERTAPLVDVGHGTPGDLADADLEGTLARRPRAHRRGSVDTTTASRRSATPSRRGPRGSSSSTRCRASCRRRAPCGSTARRPSRASASATRPARGSVNTPRRGPRRRCG